MNTIINDNISSFEILKQMKIGWNLGNTFDSNADWIESGNPVDYETSWGNPYTTQELISKINSAGFKTIRIPITWTNHFDLKTGKINTEWIKRIKEVVDFAISINMYVIINIHHEKWHNPIYVNLDNASSILNKLWTQISLFFQSYDEHLLFEGLNEPRIVGSEHEWSGGNLETHDVINKLNSTFIKTVRATGGNNSFRHLIVPTHAASATQNAIHGFEIPNDNKIIVSIHSYSPYNFALNPNGTTSWNACDPIDTFPIDDFINRLYENFISEGVPVIIGEFGAVNKNNLEERVSWAEYYVSRATEKNIVCIWWDNGLFDGYGENFGLIDRNNLTWVYPEIVSSMMKSLKPKASINL